MSTTYVRPLIPFGVACVGIALFSLMDAAMKDLSIALGAYNAVLWRNILGATLSGFVFIAKRQRWPKNAVLKLHMWRSCIVAMMAVAFFWGLARMPIESPPRRHVEPQESRHPWADSFAPSDAAAQERSLKTPQDSEQVPERKRLMGSKRSLSDWFWRPSKASENPA